MITNEVLYTDGQDIIVTPSTFEVKGVRYTLLGITKHGMAVIHPTRWPGIIMLLVGIAAALLGVAGLISSSWVGDTLINGRMITANKMALWIGLFVSVLGILLILLVKQRYAVRIATAEGEKNVVISRKPEYINQIINALNRAFMVLDVKRSHMSKTVYL